MSIPEQRAGVTPRIGRVALVAALGAAAALLISAAPARATEPQTTTEHMTVHFADLDLSKAKDTKKLYLRIRSAAEQVCGDDEPLDLFDIRGARQCESDAIGQAVQRVNTPRLTALYDRVHPRA